VTSQAHFAVQQNTNKLVTMADAERKSPTDTAGKPVGAPKRIEGSMGETSIETESGFIPGSFVPMFCLFEIHGWKCISLS
jgi:hypothetical protein